MESTELIQETSAIGTVTEKTPELTMAYVLARMETITNDMEYVYKAIAAVAALKPMEDNGAMGTQMQAQAISEVVKARETTNQQVLQFMEKMYDDLKTPQVISINAWKVEQIKEIISTTEWAVAPDVLANNFADMLQKALELA